jgi:triphosphoribosyl-dephospho-CoA synthase
MTDSYLQRTAAGLPAFSAGKLAQLACLLEVTARKPGNVHRFCDFSDLHFVDFLLSASVIEAPLDRAVGVGIGSTVLASVQATRQVVSSNSNLGIILLLAPLAAVPREASLARGAPEILSRTTREDARLVYQAIRLAKPGGMGQVDDQDLAGDPTGSLREVMTMAAERDLVARQYANGFHEVLQEVHPAIREALQAGNPLETAIISAFLRTLARHPDSLIVRKAGLEMALAVSEWAADVLRRGWPGRAPGRTRLRQLEVWLRSQGNKLNPGTTADLVTAGLFAALRDGTIQLPLPGGSAAWSAR